MSDHTSTIEQICGELCASEDGLVAMRELLGHFESGWLQLSERQLEALTSIMVLTRRTPQTVLAVMNQHYNGTLAVYER